MEFSVDSGTRSGVVGSSVPVLEKRRLASGGGRFVDDIASVQMLECAFLRSPHAHARIVSVDVEAARALDGVHGVLTGDEVRRLSKQPQPVIWQAVPGQLFPDTYALATDRVRYVGQPVAAVAAESRAVAEDALELIKVEYEVLTPVNTLDQALAPDAPKLYEDWPDNVSGRTTFSHGDYSLARESADVVVRQTFEFGRQTGVSLETRGCIAEWDPTAGELDMWLGTQAPHQARQFLSEVLGVPQSRIRVRVPDLGGGFGNKLDFYGEEVVVALFSRDIGRSVKYIEDRRESFVATAHSSEVRVEAELAARSDGTLVGMRGIVHGVLGGTLGYPGMGPVWQTGRRMLGPYRIPNAEMTVIGVMTNKTPFGSYRGWGQAQANFVHERLMDKLAAELGMSPYDLRKHNFPAPEEFPYQSAFNRFDSGRYGDCLQMCLDEVESRSWEVRRAEAEKEGRRLGYGLASYVEGTGLGPSRALGMLGLKQAAMDTVRIEIDSTGSVTLYSGQVAMGQGIETALAQVCADALGVPRSSVNVVLGDTSRTPYTGYGTAASRAATAGGAAVLRTAELLKQRILRVAAEMMEADPADLQLVDGRISVVGAPGEHVELSDVARAVYLEPASWPVSDLESSLVETSTFEPISGTFAYGTVAALVEVDRETGQTTLLDFIAAHDCGVAINPKLVEGQIEGGAAQAMGAALWEEVQYDQNGQNISTTLADYVLPTAEEIPSLTVLHMETPAPDIPGGVKGVGEGGMIPTGSAIAAAIDHAVDDTGIEITSLPVTPEKLLNLISAATPSGV